MDQKKTAPQEQPPKKGGGRPNPKGETPLGVASVGAPGKYSNAKSVGGKTKPGPRGGSPGERYVGRRRGDTKGLFFPKFSDKNIIGREGKRKKESKPNAPRKGRRSCGRKACNPHYLAALRQPEDREVFRNRTTGLCWGRGEQKDRRRGNGDTGGNIKRTSQNAGGNEKKPSVKDTVLGTIKKRKK